MKKLNILHLGAGNVGKEVIRQLAEQKKKLRKSLGISLNYVGKFNSENSAQEINDAIQKIALPFVLIDTTASDETVSYITFALKRGGFAILANKKPLSGKQKDFDFLHKLGEQRLFYECVVGAGLPIVQTLKNFITTGDKVIEIQGCFSGTLGFIFSQLDNGRLFSEAVLSAKEKGFTEPDPRDDLSGVDVARKALILARLIGRKIEIKDIQLVGLYPKKMQKLSDENFLRDLYQINNFYKQKVKEAKKKDKVLRFVAKISFQKCSVGLQEVDKSSDIGNLKGPDNLIALKTERYFKNPLVVKGPGAGIFVTAAGVFADLLSVAKIVNGGNI